MKDYVKITTTENVLTGIAICVMLFILIAMPYDIINFLRDKQLYVSVYNLDTNNDNWEWDYLLTWVYLGILVVVGFTVITLRTLKRNNKIIRWINLAFILFLFGSIIFGYSKWWYNGFDH